MTDSLWWLLPQVITGSVLSVILHLVFLVLTCCYSPLTSIALASALFPSRAEVWEHGRPVLSHLFFVCYICMPHMCVHNVSIRWVCVPCECAAYISYVNVCVCACYMCVVLGILYMNICCVCYVHVSCIRYVCVRYCAIYVCVVYVCNITCSMLCVLHMPRWHMYACVVECNVTCGILLCVHYEYLCVVYVCCWELSVLCGIWVS